MMRTTKPQILLCGVAWLFAAWAAAGQGTPLKTVRVKIITTANAPDVLKQLNEAGAAQNLQFVNDESGYAYWIEYSVKEFDPPAPWESRGPFSARGSSRPTERSDRTYKEVECVAHGGSGVNGGYQLSAHRRAAEPAQGIEDQVAKKIVKLIAKDLKRKVVLPPGAADQ